MDKAGPLLSAPKSLPADRLSELRTEAATQRSQTSNVENLFADKQFKAGNGEGSRDSWRSTPTK